MDQGLLRLTPQGLRWLHHEEILAHLCLGEETTTYRWHAVQCERSPPTQQSNSTDLMPTREKRREYKLQHARRIYACMQPRVATARMIKSL